MSETLFHHDTVSMVPMQFHSILGDIHVHYTLYIVSLNVFKHECIFYAIKLLLIIIHFDDDDIGPQVWWYDFGRW